jgi:hypothetical protein
MKLLVILLLIVNVSFAQFKTNIVNYPDGASAYHLLTKMDTTFYSYYPNGKKEASCRLKSGVMHGTYSRWYPNGNKMWEKEMKHHLADGKCFYYSTKGELVATLIYDKGSIEDTVFLKPKVNLMIGKIEFSSRIYGGMENAEGSSNISETNGPLMNYTMKIFLLDTIKKPVLIDNIKTDIHGEFIISLPQGKIGCYPNSINVSDLRAPYTEISGTMNNSGNESWDIKLPIVISKNEPLKFITIKQNSEAYAP